MTDIIDVPIWDDCPFRDKVPAPITIRRGRVDGFEEDQVIFACGSKKERGPYGIVHVDCNASAVDGPHLDANLKAILNNLGYGR